MTTTIMFSGKEGKNSSKVLAPPGGKSNNIFGFAEETAAPARARKATSQSPFAQDTPPKAQDSGPAKPFKPVSSFNPVTGEPHNYAQHSQPSPQQQAPPPQQQTQSAPPPQRQQAPPQQQQQQQQQQASAVPQQPRGGNGESKTSVKIYNPPGGKSSIQF